jgi:aerobic C4-dicarboxylate transport protein
MMIAPVIFCTIVLGIGSVRKAATVGKVGGLAFIGQTGWTAVTQLLTLMLGFYITCAIFVFGVLGALLRAVSGVSIFKLVRYLTAPTWSTVSASSSVSTGSCPKPAR